MKEILLWQEPKNILNEHFIQCGCSALRSLGICPPMNSNCLLWNESMKGTNKHSLFPTIYYNQLLADCFRDWPGTGCMCATQISDCRQCRWWTATAAELWNPMLLLLQSIIPAFPPRPKFPQAALSQWLNVAGILRQAIPVRHRTPFTGDLESEMLPGKNSSLPLQNVENRHET